MRKVALMPITALQRDFSTHSLRFLPILIRLGAAETGEDATLRRVCNLLRTHLEAEDKPGSKTLDRCVSTVYTLLTSCGAGDLPHPLQPLLDLALQRVPLITHTALSRLCRARVAPSIILGMMRFSPLLWANDLPTPGSALTLLDATGRAVKLSPTGGLSNWTDIDAHDAERTSFLRALVHMGCTVDSLPDLLPSLITAFADTPRAFLYLNELMLARMSQLPDGADRLRAVLVARPSAVDMRTGMMYSQGVYTHWLWYAPPPPDFATVLCDLGTSASIDHPVALRNIHAAVAGTLDPATVEVEGGDVEPSLILALAAVRGGHTPLAVTLLQNAVVATPTTIMSPDELLESMIDTTIGPCLTAGQVDALPALTALLPCALDTLPDAAKAFRGSAAVNGCPRTLAAAEQCLDAICAREGWALPPPHASLATATRRGDSPDLASALTAAAGVDIPPLPNMVADCPYLNAAWATTQLEHGTPEETVLSKAQPVMGAAASTSAQLVMALCLAVACRAPGLPQPSDATRATDHSAHLHACAAALAGSAVSTGLCLSSLAVLPPAAHQPLGSALATALHQQHAADSDSATPGARLSAMSVRLALTADPTVVALVTEEQKRQARRLAWEDCGLPLTGLRRAVVRLHIAVKQGGAR